MSAWGGIGGLGLGLSLLWTECGKRGIGMKRVLEWVCERPAKQVGLEGKKGALREGGDADFVVFDPEARFTVSFLNNFFLIVSKKRGDTDVHRGLSEGRSINLNYISRIVRVLTREWS